MKAIIIASSLLLSTVSQAALAKSEHSCDIHLDKDLVVNSQNVAIKAADKELWRINTQGQLWLKNQNIATDRATQQNLQQFQADIRQQTIQTLSLVEDSLVLASDAINSAVSELTGEPIAKLPALNQAVTKIKAYSERLVLQQEDGITVYGSRFDTLDDVFDQAFEQAIEQAVTQSIGSMMLVVGKALTTGEGSFEQRMDAFSQKMDNFGTQLEQRIESQVGMLEQRGEALCDSLIKLDALETAIQQAIPQLRQYDLIDAKRNDKA
ncbi:DUF2884 family protein [Rheinheimera salexigens]|uniref:Chemotaxis protein n=1 Tax=Rheinheimera salexigens TaxID=1628148 RepID=A0A1E7Q2J0_9GAMM|nr:DUF2884 family protein [Rheinheimera salexigens]OEY68395.1 hypothetical protein BI198_01540 [Rheinheimera salexigens]